MEPDRAVETTIETLEQALTAILDFDSCLMIALPVVIALLVLVGEDGPGAVGYLATDASDAVSAGLSWVSWILLLTELGQQAWGNSWVVGRREAGLSLIEA